MARCFTAACIASTSVLVVVACRTVPSRTEVPAIIVNATPESGAALSKAVSEALNGAPVKLAADALTKTDVLIIEREHPLDPTGHPLNGREREMPEHFQLIKSADQCVLVYRRTEQRFPLAGVACSALGENR
jgi:hypothetical protein